MSDDTRTFDAGESDDQRTTDRFGFLEPAEFDPTPPPLPPSLGPAPPARRQRGQAWQRAAALVLVAGALVAAVAFERPTRRPGSSVVTTTTEPPPVAVQVGTGPRSPKAFYCPEGSTTEGAEEYLVLVNMSAEEVTARLTFLVSGSPAPPVPVKVGGGSRRSLRVADFVVAQAVGTLVEGDRPGLAVAETLFVDGASRKGTLNGPCAAQVAARWFFAGGTTLRGYELWLLLLNPFPEDAVVDVVSVADGEEVRPPDFQQVPIPARSRVSLPLHEKILRKESVATTVTATRGRVAAAESTFLTEEPFGASMMIGATAPAPVWLFGEGYSGAGVTQTINVYNPGEADATAEVRLLVASGAAPDPQDVAVAARSRADVRIGATLPEGTSYGIRVAASAPVIVSRSQIATEPSPLRGYLFTVGVVAAHRTWIVPESAADPPFDAYMSVANPGSAPARLRLGSLADGQFRVPANLDGVVIEPGRRQTFRLHDYFDGPGLSLVVDADQPVVVESALYLAGPRYGSTASPGVPVQGSLVFAPTAVASKPPPTTTTLPPLTPTIAPAETETASPPEPRDEEASG